MQHRLPANAAAALDSQFAREFAPPAPPAASPRPGYAAPTYLRDVRYGQHFMFDSEPHALYVLAQFGFGKYTDGLIAVVVIAAATNDGYDKVGTISEHAPLQTVRLVDVLSPVKVRAC